MRIGKLLKVISIIFMVLFIVLTVICGVTSGVTGVNVFGVDLFGLSGTVGGIVIAICVGLSGVIAMLSLYAYGDMCQSMSTLKVDTPETTEDFADEDEDEEEDDDEDFDFE